MLREGKRVGKPIKYSVKAGKLSFVSNYVEEEIDISKLLYIFSESKVCHIYVEGMDPFDTYVTLTSLSEQLPKNMFAKANRSSVVSIKQISLIKHNLIYMSDGTEIKSTSAFKNEVKRKYSEYISKGSLSFKEWLSKQEQKYKWINNSPVPSFIAEAYYTCGEIKDFIFRYVNNSFLKFIDKRKEEVIGKTFHETFKIVNEKWIRFYADTAINGISNKIAVNCPEIGKVLYVKCYQPFYGYVVSLIIDLAEIANEKILNKA